MKNNRRDFLKITGLAGLFGAGASAGLMGCSPSEGSGQTSANTPFAMTHEEQFGHGQRFNMHGYAAPALDVVRVGVIGIGNRGSGTVRRLASIEGVEVRALSDLEEDRVRSAAESISDGHSPDLYYGGEEDWKKLCERDDIDLVAIATPWHLHTPMAVFAMEHEKHAYTELPAAQTIDECWELVETSERTRMHCMQMSASCHSGMSAVVLNMVRQGVFGELIHGEGAYIHDLMNNYNFTKDTYHNLWRLEENIDRHGSLYPQHGLVPVMQMMDINYGDQMDYLVSMSTNDFMMGKRAEELAAEDDFWEEYVGRNYRGNMNNTTIRTKQGRTILIQHDVTSPRPGVRFDLISGTEGIYEARPSRIAFDHDDGWIPEEEFEALVEEYTPEITRRFNELVEQAETERAGHSYARVNATDWRLIDCLRNGLPIEMNVYDAAISSAVIPLSERSVANRSNSVEVPDFTSGAWETNERGMDIALSRGGGDTRIV